MTELVSIGKVLKPRGLNGEIKCSVSIDLNTLNENSTLHMNNKKYLIKKATINGDFCFMILDGITTLEQAEKLRGASIMLPRNQINLTSDEILTSDLIGFEVLTSTNIPIGRVVSIHEHGGIIINARNSHDIEFSFPYEDEFVIETNMKTKQIIVKETIMEAEIAD